MSTPIKTAGDEYETMSDRALLLHMAKQLEHLDVQMHEVTRALDEAAPLLERAKAFTNPGAAVSGYLRGRKHGAGNGT